MSEDTATARGPIELIDAVLVVLSRAEVVLTSLKQKQNKLKATR
jgi:hypothetical protein